MGGGSFLVAVVWHELPTLQYSAEVKQNNRTIPLLPLCAFMADYRLNFTFTFYHVSLFILY
jgi:hypothetical protein